MCAYVISPKSTRQRSSEPRSAVGEGVGQALMLNELAPAKNERARVCLRFWSKVNDVHRGAVGGGTRGAEWIQWQVLRCRVTTPDSLHSCLLLSFCHIPQCLFETQRVLISAWGTPSFWSSLMYVHAADQSLQSDVYTYTTNLWPPQNHYDICQHWFLLFIRINTNQLSYDPT